MRALQKATFKMPKLVYYESAIIYIFSKYYDDLTPSKAKNLFFFQM